MSAPTYKLKGLSVPEAQRFIKQRIERLKCEAPICPGCHKAVMTLCCCNSTAGHFVCQNCEYEVHMEPAHA